MTLQAPYLLFLGDAPDALAAKVAQGVAHWRPDRCVGQLRLPGCEVTVGLPDMTVPEAVEAGAKTLVIGVANRGGTISSAWTEALVEAMAAGMDLAAGLHTRLNAQPLLVDAASAHGRTMHDVRVPRSDYPIAEGAARPGRRVLAVGTDCSIGKMYTTLAMEREMTARGMKATFRATGQTGILITGDGVPLDAVVADFMAGAIEELTPANDPDHFDLVEGQGSLFHPSYSGVTLALMHGSAADTLILCHEPTRTHLRGLPHYKLPSLTALADLSLTIGKVVNPDVRIAGIAINTAALHEEAAQEYCDACAQRLGVPAVDPYRHGAGALVDAL